MNIETIIVEDETKYLEEYFHRSQLFETNQLIFLKKFILSNDD